MDTWNLDDRYVDPNSQEFKDLHEHNVKVRWPEGEKCEFVIPLTRSQVEYIRSSLIKCTHGPQSIVYNALKKKLDHLKEITEFHDSISLKEEYNHHVKRVENQPSRAETLKAKEHSGSQNNIFTSKKNKKDS